jgi:site-specific recombinase XerD
MTNEEIIVKAKEEIKLRGLSQATEVQYLNRLKIFIRHYQNRPLQDMTEQDIREFLLYLANENRLATNTVNNYNNSLRFIFSVVMERTLNYRLIPRRRVHRELPAIMSREELRQFFGVINNLRDKAIFTTLYGAGLRLSEVARLRVQDIDSKNMRIFVHQGKGGKDRFTLLSSANLEALREYWKVYRPNHPEGCLFYPVKDKHRKMPICNIQYTVKKYLKKAGMKDSYSVHTFRHCFATHLLESGVDICYLKQLMGHAHIQSTAAYLNLLNTQSSIKSPLDALPQNQEHKPEAVNNNA